MLLINQPRLAWLFAIALAHTALAQPYFTDRDGRPLHEERTICGENKMVKMADENAQIQRMGLPIGIYKLNVEGGTAWCTGTLVSNDLFLTARHCAGDCTAVTVTFGYLARSQETFRCKEVVEKGSDAASDDYLIVRLEGSPGVQWGYYPLSDKLPSAGQQLLMIHHPDALPMRVSQKGCLYVGESNGLISHRCDTEGGSSGSAILLPDLDHPENTRVIGVHTLGGCTSDPASSNMGPSVQHLSGISPLVKSLVKD